MSASRYTLLLVFICLTLLIQVLPNLCSQEIRYRDYLQAYTTTGGPPPACPAEPTSDSARALLGLPPLFKPYTEGAPVEMPEQPLELPGELPEVQAFRYARSEEDETLLSLSCMRKYQKFSHEVCVKVHSALQARRHPFPLLPLFTGAALLCHAQTDAAAGVCMGLRN